MKPSQLAINTISVRFSDFEKSAKAVRKAGFRKIEFYLPHVKSYLENGRSVQEVRDLLDQLELQCIGGFETHLQSFGSDKEKNHDLLIRNAELLSQLGGRSLVVGTDGPSGRPELGNLDQIAADFRSVCDTVREFGVDLLLEFNWGPVVRSLRSAVEVIRRAEVANAGILFDPAHYHCTSTKAEQMTRETVSLIRHVHVNDMRDVPGEFTHCNSDRVLPGAGCVGLRNLLRLLEDAGYDGDYSIEMFDPALQLACPEESSERLYQSLTPLVQARSQAQPGNEGCNAPQ